MTESPGGVSAQSHLRQMAKFWWVFAMRGASAILFAVALAFAGSLLGTLFFNPVRCLSMGSHTKQGAVSREQ